MVKAKAKLRRKSLQKWCDDYGRGARAFLAEECEIRWATIHDILRGTSRPTVPTAKAIEKATSGEVAWTSMV